MMRSLYSAVSGLSVHETALDIVGNNISNVNTTGYKSSTANFQEIFSQTLEGATSAQDGVGGTNPEQVGLGVTLASTTTNMESGSITSTGNDTDMAMDGDGFFVVSDGDQDYYTRNGSFSFDEEGYLTYSSNGYYVQGWVASEDGVVSVNSESTENISLDQTMEPSATSYTDFSGNIDSTTNNTLEASNSEIDVEDGDGNTDSISIELTETGYNTWEYTLTSDSDSDFTVNGSTYSGSVEGTIELNNDGEVTSLTAEGEDLFSNDLELDLGGTNTVTLGSFTGSFDVSSNAIFSDSTTGEEITADFEFEATESITTDVIDSQGNSHTVTLVANKTGDNTWEINSSEVSVTDASNASTANNTTTLTFNDDGELTSGSEIELSFEPNGLDNSQTVSIDLAEITQYSDDTEFEVSDSDGYTAGSLESYSVGESGIITGSYDNGYSKVLAQLAVGNCSNSSGLLSVGDTLYKESNNSGDMSIGAAGTRGTGTIAGSSLEESNVDLSEQFTEMITAQRGYQANSKILTTADEMLQTLMNVKR